MYRVLGGDYLVGVPNQTKGFSGENKTETVVKKRNKQSKLECGFKQRKEDVQRPRCGY